MTPQPVISSRLALHALPNTRDLGGMAGADGRTVCPGRMLRSGQLFFADASDLARLGECRLTRIFDFRSPQERDEKPDPELPGAENVFLPIVRDMTAGITHEQKQDVGAFDALMREVVDHPGFAETYMRDTYLTMVTDGHAVDQYGRFVRAACETLCAGGNILWHCTAGKDRAGFAAILMLTLLGTPREAIYADYCATGVYLAEEVDRLVAMVAKRIGLGDRADEVRTFFSIDPRWLDALYARTETDWGGMEGFVRERLGVDDAMRDALRAAVLR